MVGNLRCHDESCSGLALLSYLFTSSNLRFLQHKEQNKNRISVTFR